MTKKVLVLGRRASGQKNNPELFSESLNANINTSFADYSDLEFHISNEVSVCANGHDLKDYRLIIFMGWYANRAGIYYKDIAYACALYLKSKGVKFWNSEVLAQRSTTKLSAMVELSLGGVQVPETWFSVSKEYYKQVIGTETNVKYVYKAIATSRGKDNYLVSTKVEISDKGQDVGCMMLQEFIPNEFDLRIICVSSEPIIALRRQAGADTHLNNTSQGGTTTRIQKDDIDKSAVVVARKSARILRREIGGVDLVFSKRHGNFLCLEVNPLPQITSGVDVQHKLNAISTAISEILKEGK